MSILPPEPQRNIFGRPACAEQHTIKVYADGSEHGEWVRGSAASYGILIQGNLQPQWKARCLTCCLESSPIPQKIAREWALPIEWVREAPRRNYPQCTVGGCEADGVDYHHFAPRNTFGDDADSWPCLPVCKTHHLEWHRRMDGYRWQRRSEVAE